MRSRIKIGLNKRDLELSAVWDYSSSSLDSFLFGSGLGGGISSAVSGGHEWRFVHNMFAYYLFKTGIIGLLIYSVFFFYLIRHIFSAINFSWVSNPFLYKSYAVIFSNFIINGFLEAGFKSLSFGIFLCLAFSYCCYFKEMKIKTWKIIMSIGALILTYNEENILKDVLNITPL